MKLQRRVALIAVVLALVAAACAPKRESEANLAGTTITFSVGVAKAEVPAIEHLLRTFQDHERVSLDLELVSRFRNQPDVRVNLLTTLSRPQLDQRLRGDVRGGKPSVHLFARDNVELDTMVREGLVEPLTGIEIQGALLANSLPTPPGGELFFLPLRPNVRVVYANKERLRQAGVEPPRTLDDLRIVARRLKEVAGTPKVTLSLAAGEPAAVTMSELVLSYGGDPLVLNDAGSIQAFQFVQQLWGEGLLARESLFGQFDTEIDYLRDETTWLAQNWSYTSSQLPGDLLQRFEIYAGWEGPAGSRHVIGGDVLGLPAGVTGKEREAALDLARFLISEESQQALARANSWPSILGSTYDRVGDDQRPTFVAIQHAIQQGWSGRAVSYWCHVSDEINDAIGRIVIGQQDAKTVLDDVHAAIQVAKERGTPCPPGE